MGSRTSFIPRRFIFIHTPGCVGSDLNTNGAKVELGKIRENGEIKCSSEREEGKEGKEGK